ncbi:thiamine biosynthesis protein ThiJ [Paenibacillus sp. PCH8]|uniref:DJ-1/PfpI family protein n=1 Tax=Paenibacillus sp. PCH8 TaxID=2066524 RepID=UPI000CF9DC45|nr:DJ-1/PfpI family protein [Paenibacillus sp. PCH8]PQP82594.1 thiamine biosynthesis protein ThiJ [Paenibacillus sp. PCH8]
MKIAFFLFDGLTFLDFVGFYDVINRLNFFEQTKGTTWETCAMTDQVTDESGLTLKVDRVKPDLADYDLVFIPGGMGTRKLRYDEAFVGWLKQAESVPLKVSVCTGSLLLGAAGFLSGKRATTHPGAYDLLEPYVTEVIQKRIVKDGNVITAGGVATSIDLGIYVVGLLAGEEAAANVKIQIDYPYEMQGAIEI